MTALDPTPTRHEPRRISRAAPRNVEEISLSFPSDNERAFSTMMQRRISDSYSGLDRRDGREFHSHKSSLLSFSEASLFETDAIASLVDKSVGFNIFSPIRNNIEGTSTDKEITDIAEARIFSLPTSTAGAFSAESPSFRHPLYHISSTNDLSYRLPSKVTKVAKTHVPVAYSVPNHDSSDPAPSTPPRRSISRSYPMTPLAVTSPVRIAIAAVAGELSVSARVDGMSKDERYRLEQTASELLRASGMIIRHMKINGRTSVRY